jgi:predicted acetyltransferase
MPFDVRPSTTVDEYKAALYGIGQYFGPPLPPERIERFLKILPLERMHAAYDGASIVGGAGVFPYTLSVPGGLVACAGVTVVGVYPTHRRRGVLSAMMKAQLEDSHQRKEPIAALWASEDQIYGRFGYGQASQQGSISLAREHTQFRKPVARTGTLRFIEQAEAVTVFPEVWEHLRTERSGVFSRSNFWWEYRTFRDLDPSTPKRFVVLTEGQRTQGYAIYRHIPKFDGPISSARIEVTEAVGITPSATAQLWRYLLDIDWIESISSSLMPPDHPLLCLLASPRRAKFTGTEGIWVRLVDVAAALSARTYAAPHRLTFDVRDEYCPWNQGRFTLEDGRASKSNDAPDITCDVSALGSVYLGGVSFRRLADAGLIEAQSPNAISIADAAFRAERLPWCPEIF